jgi:hypothetical protein
MNERTVTGIHSNAVGEKKSPPVETGRLNDCLPYERVNNLCILEKCKKINMFVISLHSHSKYSNNFQINKFNLL